MSVIRCQCGAVVEWLVTRYGRRLPFAYPPIPVADDTERRGWAPGTWHVRGVPRLSMAPVGDYTQGRQASIKHVVLLHVCEAHKDRVNAMLDYRRQRIEDAERTS